MPSKAELAGLVVLVGCCSNVVFLELLVTEAPGIGNLVTFLQFLVIATEGFFFTINMGRTTPKVPFTAWLKLVVMYFLVSVVNNYALNFHIPMPLHMIFRAGSLLANMIMGVLLLGKEYTPAKYISVMMISIGIALCTIMSAQTHQIKSSEGADMDNFWLTIGILLLTFALFMSARMGIYQEVIYKQHGKHPKEAMFFLHALPLPGFLFLAPDIYNHLVISLNSSPITIPILHIQVRNIL
jgi:UDP-xylose/UDP-N-acetylglucosamine transporter B4